MRSFIAAIAAMAMAIPAQSKIVTYPAGQGVETLDDFTVRIRPQDRDEWQEIAVYPVKVDRVADARHNVEIASMAYLDADEPIFVEVTANRTDAVESCRVRPLSYGINAETEGQTVTFAVERPQNLSVEVNGDIFHNLHLFVNPLDQNRPAKINKKNKNLIYFAPGVHQLDGDTMRIASGQTVYIDGGARVVGQLIVDGEKDVKIFGRGEVHPEGRGEGIYIKRSKNVEVDGVIVTQCPVGESDSVKVTNVKSISSYGWGDGLNVFASSNVYYSDCFCRNSDDCSTVYATRKGFQGGCANILMENSTLWADVAHPIMIGLHGNPENPDIIENVTYRNLDILDQAEYQIDYQGCFGISCGDNNLVRNVTFEDIRVEDFRKGQLVNIRLFYNKKYCAAPGIGIENVLFRNVEYTGNNATMSVICGYDESRKVKNVVFDNLVINGEHIYDDMPQKPKWYKTSDFANMFIGEHVEGVTFK
ncbi:MAG: glycoside hydrolase family 28 protein [Bacteroidales bacterium]|nr:glycoside hydrolase family 28 protein [Bacteroidales bacterium]